MSRRTRHLLRLAAEQDNTFQYRRSGEREYLVGRCIHCQSAVSVPLSRSEPAHATLEHIVPKHHGGSDAPDNLAVACARCNQGKGRRLDKRRRDDAAGPGDRHAAEPPQGTQSPNIRQLNPSRVTAL